MTSPPSAATRCQVCILPQGFPGLSFNDAGVCCLCTGYTPPSPPLGEAALLAAVKTGAGPQYDCVVPLSGGKDSSYVLYYAVRRLGLRVLAVNYDSGFQSPQATANIANACEALGVHCRVFHAEPAHRISLLRQVVRIAGLTGTPVGVCGNCETAIRHYAIRTAREAGGKTILFGNSAAELIPAAFPTGVRRALRHISLGKLPTLTRAMFGYFQAACREKYGMGLPKRYAFRPSMAPLPFPEPEVRVVHFFDYLRWETMHQQELLGRELGWQAPPARLARFDCLLHPLFNLAFLKETGISHDGYVLANLVRDGLLTREQALAQEREVAGAVVAECLEFVRRHGLDAEGTDWVVL
jgi:hypothetical protein